MMTMCMTASPHPWIPAFAGMTREGLGMVLGFLALAVAWWVAQ